MTGFPARPTCRKAGYPELTPRSGSPAGFLHTGRKLAVLLTLAFSAAAGLQTYIAHPGVHGSSMLADDPLDARRARMHFVFMRDWDLQPRTRG